MARNWIHRLMSATFRAGLNDPYPARAVNHVEPIELELEHTRTGGSDIEPEWTIRAPAKGTSGQGLEPEALLTYLAERGRPMKIARVEVATGQPAGTGRRLVERLLELHPGVSVWSITNITTEGEGFWLAMQADLGLILVDRNGRRCFSDQEVAEHRCGTNTHGRRSRADSPTWRSRT